jgi:hypothetical protein
MFCPRCGAEYRAGFTRCSDCDLELVDERPGEHPDKHLDEPLDERPAENPSDDGKPSQLVVVGTSHSEFEARVAESALADAGIEAVVRNDDAGGFYPFLSFTQGVQLLVRAEDAKEAREILSDTTPDPEPPDAE